MPKASSPVRLQEELMQAAKIAGTRLHRSAAEQIEYWASLGRQINRFVDHDTLLKISMGLARLKVESTVGRVIDPETVFAAIESDRKSGELAEKVVTAQIRYQASTTHPGYLEQIDARGNRRVGTFQQGRFIPMDEK